VTHTSEQVKGEPTPEQLERCKAVGWEYLGDGFFVKNEVMGWYEGRNFVKE